MRNHMKHRFIYILTGLALLMGSCDVLDRPSRTTAEDESYWKSEESLRLYANSFYGHFFIGYGVKYTTAYAPGNSYSFNDDVLRLSSQSQFTRSVPTSKGSTSLDLGEWQSEYTGPDWNFAWIRKANIMSDRMEARMKGTLSDEQFNHWMGIARFFRGLEYARLVNVFGDVPYYDYAPENTELNALYKDRDNRDDVMDHVFDDFEFALANVRLNDGQQQVNRYIVSALVSRWALIEGSWQKYYYQNDERAKKFFNLAVEAADKVISSGKYAITEEFRNLFGSKDLTSSKDVILYRKYDASQGVTHCVASYCNVNDPTDIGANLTLIKSFICNDGKAWNDPNSTVAGASDFSLANLIKTRDPRFEATFYNKTTPKNKASYLYMTKFIPRSALEYLNKKGGTPAPEFQGEKNVTGYPVLRYAEVLLNWIEAKAELQFLGEGTVTQEDIDNSINAIRHRPIAEEAMNQGVQQTADMKLATLTDDPSRDKTVPALLWEIRRERRMEFAFEFSRIIDLRRWGKVEYMDTDLNKELLMGTWVNFDTDAPDELKPANVNKLRVVDMKGKEIVYNGSNAAQMKGFFYSPEALGRQPYMNIPNVNPYLCPIGTNQISDYKKRGYTLTQTEGWPDEQ